MKFGEVKVLEVRLCLVSLGYIDRQTDLFWKHVLLCYAPEALNFSSNET